MNLDVAATGSEEDLAQKQAELVKHWLGEIDAALQREKDFRKQGDAVVELYEGEKKEAYQFNILYSNTETLSPALYNTTPRPVVQRRFKDADPLGALAAKAGQRVLEYLLDDGMSEYSTFDELLKSATLEALVPGRGVTKFKYEAVFEKLQNEKAAEAAETSGAVVDPDEDAEAEGHIAADPEKVTYESACGEEVPWDRFLHGYAKKWKDVPWVDYTHFMTKEELEQNFGPAGSLVPVAEPGREDDDTGKAPEGAKGTKVAMVHEIWDKTTRRVLFITPNWKDAPLKVIDDPLKLSGFFNCPKPLTLLPKISTLVPVNLYRMYEEQAKELNRVTTRINKLVSALKVRGMYDATVQGIDKVMEADDNILVPADNVAAMLANGNALEKAIWLLPIEKLVVVLQQLYLQRNQVKQVIYEITGIADIMRGSSQASETLGAQQLKNQWGTLRLKRMQKEVGRYARDCLRLLLEIAVTKLSEDTLQAMTGLPIPTGAQKQQVLAQIQQLVLTGQQPPPEIVKIAQQPSWTDILKLLQNDLQRSFRIDIETNSTVDAEATEDKQNIAELLNAISQFLNGVSPLVQEGAMPFEVASGMLLAIVRRFRFGPELEDLLKEMKPPAPQQKSSPELEAAQKQLQQEVQKAQQERAKLEQDKAMLKLSQAAAQKEQELQQHFDEQSLAMQKRFDMQEIALREQLASEKLAMQERKVQDTHKRAQQDLADKQKRAVTAVQDASAKPSKEASEPEEKEDGVERILTSLPELLRTALAQVNTAKRLVKTDSGWESHPISTTVN